MSLLHAYFPPRIPLEVCEKVIESVWHMSTRYNCCLVCRDWVPKSRIHLFRDVRISDDETATKFMNAVFSSPGIGTYVLELVLDLRYSSGSWIYRFVQALPPFLINLTRLEYRNLPALNPLFYALSSRFNTISELILFGLKKQSFREVLQLANRCNNLRSVTLIDCDWKSPTPLYARQGFTAFYRFYLEPLRGCHNFQDQRDDVLRWLTTTKSASTLGAFHLVISDLPDRIPRLPNLLGQCSTTLQTLTLDIKTSFSDVESGDPFPSSPSIPSCIAIRDLRISYNNGDLPSFFQFLRQFFSRSKSLRNIALRFHTEEHFNVDFIPHWKAIDDTLASSKFLDLQSVEISEKFPSRAKEWQSGAGRKYILERLVFLGKLLPELNKRGILWWGDSGGSGMEIVMQGVPLHKSSAVGDTCSPLTRESVFNWRRRP